MSEQSPTLREWVNEHPVGDEMLWKRGSEGQNEFFYDIQGLIGVGLAYEDAKNLARVISTHRSKSIVLPVVEYNREDLGLRLILRNNFYNWKLSVISTNPIKADFSNLFFTIPPVEPEYTGDPLHPVYFEGFPRELIFGYYTTSDGRHWSAEIGGDKTLWTVLFLIMRAVEAFGTPRWAQKGKGHTTLSGHDD